MTSINEARQAIQKRFILEWADETPFVLFNEQFKIPDNSDWAELSVVNIVSNQETLGKSGNRKYFRAGKIFLSINVRSGTGTQRADFLSKKANDIFEGEKFDGVFVNDCLIREFGQNGRFLKYLVECDFFYYETK